MKTKGFTLIELLVAMTIAAVLIGISLVSYQGVRKSARDGKRKADLEQIRSALEMCRTDTGVYPDEIYDGISCNGNTYLEKTPKDPVSEKKYYFSKLLNGYNVCTRLEVGGADGDCGTAVCGLNNELCNYKLTNP